MAQSTTIINAKGLITSIGGTAIAGSLASVTLTVNIENSQHYTADGAFADALVGKKNWAGTINCYYSETAGEAYPLIVAAADAGTSTAVVINVAGGGAGDEGHTGNVLFTSVPYNFVASSADAIMIAFPFIGKGALTRADV